MIGLHRLFASTVHRPLAVFFGMIACLVAILPSGPQCQAQSEEASSRELRLMDEDGEIGRLEIGRSLFVSGSGFEGFESVEVTLSDEFDWPVISAQVAVAGSGRFDAFRLWNASGIVGCDCRKEAGHKEFARMEEAVFALEGRTFKVSVESEEGEELAAGTVSMVAPKRKIAFASDASGCPRFHFSDGEDIYFNVWGGSEGEIVAVTLGAPDDPTRDVRSERPEGDTFTLHGASTLVAIWRGDSSSPGDFALLARGSDWPFNIRVFTDPHINSGIVVHDHYCPPPPGPG